MFVYKDMILKNLYKTNRERLIRNLKSRTGDLNNCIILMRGSMHYPEYDSDTNYYQPVHEYNFTYLFGVRKMGVDGMIDLETSKAYLIAPDPDLKGNIEHKPVDKQLLEDYGIDHVMSKTEFRKEMEKRKIRKIYVYRGISSLHESESHYFDDLMLIQSNAGRVDYDTLYPVLNNTRTIKSDVEMEFMRDICRISSEAHIYIMQNCMAGIYEYQIEALYWVS